VLIFSQPVEADDDYFGGENPGGKAGRGSENKVPFIAAVLTSPPSSPDSSALRPAPGNEPKLGLDWLKMSTNQVLF